MVIRIDHRGLTEGGQRLREILDPLGNQVDDLAFALDPASHLRRLPDITAARKVSQVRDQSTTFATPDWSSKVMKTTSDAVPDRGV